MKKVEFYYDLVSPYSYLAWGELGRICREQEAELELRPMLLGAIHKAVGLQAPIEVEAKARYQVGDIRRWAEHYNLPLDFPNPFPFRTLKTMRAAVSLKNGGALAAFTREAFALYWEEGGAPKGTDAADEDEPISEISRRIDADPDRLLANAASPEAKDGLKESTSRALDRGVFGAPTFFVGDEMFWGNDRLHFVEAALEDDAARRPESRE